MLLNIYPDMYRIGLIWLMGRFDLENKKTAEDAPVSDTDRRLNLSPSSDRDRSPAEQQLQWFQKTHVRALHAQ